MKSIFILLHFYTLRSCIINLVCVLDHCVMVLFKRLHLDQTVSQKGKLSQERTMTLSNASVLVGIESCVVHVKESPIRDDNSGIRSLSIFSDCAPKGDVIMR